MWPKGVLFCCLSFLLLPMLAHKSQGPALGGSGSDLKTS